MEKSYHVITFISKYLFLKKLIVADFPDIIKIATIFVKTIFKDSLKELENMYYNAIYIRISEN